MEGEKLISVLELLHYASVTSRNKMRLSHRKGIKRVKLVYENYPKEFYKATIRRCKTTKIDLLFTSFCFKYMHGNFNVLIQFVTRNYIGKKCNYVKRKCIKGETQAQQFCITK